jgi:hypothetical protein
VDGDLLKECTGQVLTQMFSEKGQFDESIASAIVSRFDISNDQMREIITMKKSFYQTRCYFQSNCLQAWDWIFNHYRNEYIEAIFEDLLQWMTETPPQIQLSDYNLAKTLFFSILEVENDAFKPRHMVNITKMSMNPIWNSLTTEMLTKLQYWLTLGQYDNEIDALYSWTTGLRNIIKNAEYFLAENRSSLDLKRTSVDLKNSIIKPTDEHDFLLKLKIAQKKFRRRYEANPNKGGLDDLHFATSDQIEVDHTQIRLTKFLTGGSSKKKKKRFNWGAIFKAFKFI